MVQFAPMKFIYQSKCHDVVPIRPMSIKRLIINLVNNAKRYGEPPIYFVSGGRTHFYGDD